MSDKNSKHLRSLLRDEAKALIPTYVENEVFTSAAKKLEEQQRVFNEGLSKLISSKLETIEQDCKASLEKQDKRARAVQGFLVQNAQKEINDHVHNIHVTLLAWEELMTQKIYNTNELLSSLTDENKATVQAELKSLLNQFSQELDEQKKVVASRMQAAAEAAMTKRITPEEQESTVVAPSA